MMVISKTKRGSADEYVEEVQSLIRTQYPGAEFRIKRHRRNEITIDVTTESEIGYMFSKSVAERTTQILVDTGVNILVISQTRDAV